MLEKLPQYFLCPWQAISLSPHQFLIPPRLLLSTLGPKAGLICWWSEGYLSTKEGEYMKQTVVFYKIAPPVSRLTVKLCIKFNQITIDFWLKEMHRETALRRLVILSECFWPWLYWIRVISGLKAWPFLGGWPFFIKSGNITVAFYKFELVLMHMSADALSNMPVHPLFYIKHVQKLFAGRGRSICLSHLCE